MPGLDLETAEWMAVREAVLRIPAESRSERLKSALQGIDAVLTTGGTPMVPPTPDPEPEPESEPEPPKEE